MTILFPTLLRSQPTDEQQRVITETQVAKTATLLESIRS